MNKSDLKIGDRVKVGRRYAEVTDLLPGHQNHIITSRGLQDLRDISVAPVKANRPFDPSRVPLISNTTARYFRDVFDRESEYSDLKDRVTYQDRPESAFVQEEYNKAYDYLQTTPEIVAVYRILLKVLKEIPTALVIELFRYRGIPTNIEQQIAEERDKAIARKKAEYEAKQK